MRVIYIALGLVSQGTSMDLIKSLWTGEQLITDTKTYAVSCLNSGDYPILENHDYVSCPVRSSSIPVTSFMYSASNQDTQSATEMILSTTQNHSIRAHVQYFRLQHYLTGVDFAKEKPWIILGSYAGLYLMPAMLSTPLLTAGLLVGVGYTWWSNRQSLSQLSFKWDSVVSLTGLKTSVGEALAKSKVKLEPSFNLDGTINFQGYIPNGIIPGQSLYIDLTVKPVAILTK